MTKTLFGEGSAFVKAKSKALPCTLAQVCNLRLALKNQFILFTCSNEQHIDHRLVREGVTTIN
jgi:hypothetical protein